MDEIKDMLSEELKSEIDNLATLTPGSEEHTAAVDSLTKLYKLRIEEAKAEAESEDKSERRSMEAKQHEDEIKIKTKQQELDETKNNREEQLSRDQLKAETKNGYFRLSAESATTLLTLGFYAWWMFKGFKFEETGTITSPTFKGLISRFKPTKK